MERNMALIGFGQLDTKQQFFSLTHQVHKETGVGLADKLRGSTSCAGVTSRVKHAMVQKTLTQACDFFYNGFTREPLDCLEKGVFVWAKQATIFIRKV